MEEKNILNLLPGKNTRKTLKSAMLRVDHAGEYGAVHIYRGQASVLSQAQSKQNTWEHIQEMEQQEHIHLNKFNQVLPQRHIRPSLLTPLWKRGGFLLGAVSTLISEKSAMACTEAVETVIDKHYQHQIDYFQHDHDALLNDLKQFQQDELAHKHQAQEAFSAQAPLYKPMNFAIQKLCACMIKVAAKL